MAVLLCTCLIMRTTGLLFCKGCTIFGMSAGIGNQTFTTFNHRKCYTNDEPQPFSLIAAFFRLGTKYEIPHLRSEAIKRLIHDYPLTLKDWDHYDMRDVIIWEPGQHFSVANFAREVGLTSILPAAFYFACETYSLVEILEGVRDDGHYAILSAENQKACLRGRERLIETQHSHTFKWMDATDVTLSPGCSNIEKCNQWRMSLFCKTFRGQPVCCPLVSWLSDDGGGFCGPCVSSSRAMFEVGRANIWNELPSTFGLPTWEELVKE